MNKEMQGTLEMIVAGIFTGLMAILVRFGGSLGAHNLAFFRILLTTLFIYLIFSSFRKKKITDFKHEKKKMIVFGAVRAFTILFYFASILFLSVSVATLLLATLSIWAVIFSYFILKEKILRKTILALMISFTGLIILIYPQTFSLYQNTLGVLFGIAAGVLGGLAYAMSKTFHKYDKVSLAFWQNLLSTPFLLPLLFMSPPVITLNGIFVILSLGITGALSLVFLYSGLGKISGQKGGVLSMLKTPFAVAFGIILFGEMLVAGEIIGGVMIIIGAVLISKN